MDFHNFFFLLIIVSCYEQTIDRLHRMINIQLDGNYLYGLFTVTGLVLSCSYGSAQYRQQANASQLVLVYDTVFASSSINSVL